MVDLKLENMLDSPRPAPRMYRDALLQDFDPDIQGIILKRMKERGLNSQRATLRWLLKLADHYLTASQKMHSSTSPNGHNGHRSDPDTLLPHSRRF